MRNILKKTTLPSILIVLLFLGSCKKEELVQSPECDQYSEIVDECRATPSWSCVVRAINCEKEKQNQLKNIVSSKKKE